MKSILGMTLLVLLGGAVGAAIGWVNANSELTRDKLAIVSPELTAQIETAVMPENYQRSIHFAVCEENYAPALKNATLNKRATACECYDNAVSQWSLETQKASWMTVSAVRMPLDRTAPITNRHFLENNVSTAATDRINFAAASNAGWYQQVRTLEAVELVDSVTIARTADRVERLLDQCGILSMLQRPRTFRQVEEFWERSSIGGNG